ncbi:hypothetical protein MNV49_003646 [Pseudohyphozyma bogoriensis]|nr:hypothetical protein MNV49_003646 [Pseudohyphozyma bogoriensis]
MASRGVVLLRSAPSQRSFSTFAPALSKASKARTTRGSAVPKRLVPGITKKVEPIADTAAQELPVPTKAQKGKAVVKASKVLTASKGAGAAEEGASLFEDEVPEDAGKSEVERTGSSSKAEAYVEPPIASIKERKEAQKKIFDNYGPEEVIYTATAPFNPAALMTAAFVMSVFAFNAADIALNGTEYNEDTGEDELAPKWKRWSFATGFAAAGTGIVIWGALVPARPLNVTSGFPQDALVGINTPVTRLPGLSARHVPVSSISLLGPLTLRRQAYHPTVFNKPITKPRKGDAAKSPISKILEAVFPTNVMKTKDSWNGPVVTHAPIIVKGDRASYSLARQGREIGKEKIKTWCKDWAGVEKAFLGVEEKSV